ncbi:MAG: dTDP-4-dehydrorhamnose reductase [Methyloceanibacter sp.]
MTSKIMVFGAGGQIGRHLIESCSRAGCEAVGLTRAEADICEPAAVAEAIGRHAPTTIVNAAAYTAVDKAESESEQAFAVNRDGAAVLARAAAKAGLPLIHLSTDYVFDGLGRTPYREDDPVGPQGAYARSKEAGEGAVRDAHDRHLILRTSWVYGPFGTNFLRTMLQVGAERDELAIVDDQTGCPTATVDIAAAIMAMAASAERGDFTAWGTYHYAGADAVTWHGFATMIFAEAAKFGRKSPRLRPIATADYPTTAPRPAYSVLSPEKIRRIFGIEPRPLRDSLVESLERLLD